MNSLFSNARKYFVAACALGLLSGCSTTKYTVDDGRPVNEQLLANIRSYGKVESAIRPAIARTSELKDPDCDFQWELPMSVATSDGAQETDRVAWVRALNVDERLTVIGTTTDSPLKLGEKIQEIGGYRSEDALKMSEGLLSYRDSGRVFDVKTITGKVVRIAPFKVCRGYARFAPPTTPKAQDYHWLLSVHPLQISEVNLTLDEALWVVLWTQGVSEVGGVRMKTYHYGTKIGGTLYNLFTIASGIKGVALAAEAAAKAAKEAGVAAAAEFVKLQVKNSVTDTVTEQVKVTVEKLGKQAASATTMAIMQQAAANRGALNGVAWVASTVFDKADNWAFERMEKLGANPLAAFSLHQKLVEAALAENAFLFDADRLGALGQLAHARDRGAEMVAILKGIRPEDFQPDFGDMPLASNRNAFSFADPMDQRRNSTPFAYGLIDGMLNIPIETKSGK